VFIAEDTQFIEIDFLENVARHLVRRIGEEFGLNNPPVISCIPHWIAHVRNIPARSRDDQFANSKQAAPFPCKPRQDRKNL
jgi:hypothetical protein